MGCLLRAVEQFADELLGPSDGELLGPYLLRQPGHLLFGLQPQQRAGVSFGELSVANEGLLGGRGLQRAQVLPLQVLHERQLHRLVLACLSDEYWHPFESGFLRRPQPSLPCYELEAARRRSDDQRLQYTDLLYGSGELSYPCLREATSRLARVRADRRYWQFLEFQSSYALS